MNGENNSLPAKDRIENFLAQIDEYVNNLGVYKKKKFSEDHEIANQIEISDLEELSQQSCFDFAFILYDYASHIQMDVSRQKVALNWCTNTLNDYLSRAKDNYDDDWWKYTKHEMKLPIMAKENSFIASILKFKQHAEARIQALDGVDQLIKRKAECLMEKGKRL